MGPMNAGKSFIDWRKVAAY
ncbi:hypothetical protein ACNKHR_16900 [Shigella flexneri]